MNDKQLADAVVALGVGGYLGEGKFAGGYCVKGMSRHLADREFVRDWRVAGALVEQIIELHYVRCDGAIYVVIDDKSRYFETESLPRAIIEACVMALREDDDE